MWYRLYDGPDEAVGPLIAGRLRGRAQQIAMNLRLPDPHGHVDVGDAALVRLSVDEVTDPVTGAIIQQAMPSGVQALLHALRSAFGEAEQLQATKALEVFFEFRRGRLPIPEWSVQWELNLEEAVLHAGLEVNQVAKTYLYFKSSGLPQKTVDDLLLQVHGDMRRFEEVRTLLLRMAHRSMDTNQTTMYEEAYNNFHLDDTETNSWSTVTDNSWHDEWNAHYFQDELYAWYEDPYEYYEYPEDEWHEQWNYDAGFDEEPSEQAEQEQSEAANTDENDGNFYKGKGKSRSTTMGLGCSLCGSKWHNTHSCPLSEPKGKSSSKGHNRPKGKGFNKGYGKFPYRKGFGKSKGYGKKGKYPKKGFGKKGGFWSDELPQNFTDYYGGSYLMNFKENIPATSSVTTSAPRLVAMDSPEKEELLTGKKVRFEEQPPGVQEDEKTSEKISKRLNFPEMETTNIDNYHMVRGDRICGLLVDPGAASGLIGTDTLRELLDAGMVPRDRADEVSWGPSTTKVTGISGQSDDTLARVSLPFVMPDGAEGGVPGNYSADLIGGHGSTCPALLPNTSLRQMRSAVLTQWYENGDGILVCSTNDLRPDQPGANLVILRLLLTESGHYVLPIQKDLAVAAISDDEKEQIRRLWTGQHQQQPYQATTLEQTDIKQQNIDEDKDKEKLQFNMDCNPKDLIQNNSKDLIQSDSKDLIHCSNCEQPAVDVPNDGLRTGHQQVADDEPPIQVLMGNDFNMDYDEGVYDYGGDVFPGHLPEGKLRYLQKMYKAVPEEFYTKTRKTPVTPRNARSWMKKRKGSKFHFWEWCSGSGRLSLIALLSGLCVLFPIDYRYGWDLSHPEHQRIILEIEQNFNGDPDVLFASPTCRPWSISSTRRDLAQTQQEREAEMPTINFIKNKLKRRCKEKKGNILEQPWSSALWPHLEDLPGEVRRTDQCRFKAQDEQGSPILKPTGLYSDFYLRHSIARCAGHQGRKHGWLQGAVQGMNRTTLAAVYTETFCKSIVKDIKWFINQLKNYDNFYKCEKCSMGRAAPAGMEHSFLPGECRYGKWPQGEDPRERKRLEKEQQDKDDIFETFRRESLSNPKVMQGRLSAHTSFSFNSEQTAVLKMCLIKLLSESVDEFEAYDKRKHDHNYVHWLQDPTALSWLKNSLKEYMIVEGAMACLQPWSTPTPNPQMTVEEAPLRLLLRGTVESWKMDQIEDLRELSLSQ